MKFSSKPPTDPLPLFWKILKVVIEIFERDWSFQTKLKISNEIEVRRCHHVIVIAVFVIVILLLLLLIIIIISIIIVIIVVIIFCVIRLWDINIFINHPFGWLTSQNFGAGEATAYVWISSNWFAEDISQKWTRLSLMGSFAFVFVDKGVFNIDVLLHHLRSNQVGFVSKMRGWVLARFVLVFLVLSCLAPVLWLCLFLFSVVASPFLHHMIAFIILTLPLLF